ncbi:MAG TPA: hypothetical protein VGB89_15610 [Bacteroidota bacterium]
MKPYMDGTHIPEADVILYIEDRLEPVQRETIESHLADCPVCAGQLAAAIRIDDVMAGEGHIVDEATREKADRFVRPSKSNRPGLFNYLLNNPFRVSLAGGAAVAVLFLLYSNVTEDPVPQFRTPNAAQPMEILAPEDGATFSTTKPVFSWRSIPHSFEYRFILYDARGITMWKRELADTTLELPPSVVLEPGMSYLWRVETLFPNGEQTRSKLNAFTYLASQ